MANYNRVVLVGNITRDIELRYTPGGMAVVDVGLAISEKRKSSSGDWVDDTVFVDVTLWGRNAEVASEYLGKGSSVLIEGRLKYDTWEADGQKRSKLRVVGEKIQFLGSPKGSHPSGGTVRSDAPKGTQQSSSPNAGPSEASKNKPPVADPSGESSSTSPPHSSPPGVREAQPTGDGPGYGDPEIPF
ncbi:Single-stranded DNA-binding protein [Novipirellula aureliae]|uniref:Single-stranded DNA-binding protein n=1 Tax=Novipirellula aureliae TaxID=2527966 RepID=A0A5C6E2U8_9BACT|nr:single-stranded DNA-binding protein [Novipirellula aureliae]TWU41469.1 Single-stranded DNA-binding protein [Novipirellula aureliae]